MVEVGLVYGVVRELKSCYYCNKYVKKGEGLVLSFKSWHKSCFEKSLMRSNQFRTGSGHERDERFLDFLRKTYKRRGRIKVREDG